MALAISALLFLGLPLLLLLILKANAGVMFLAACSGIVLLSSLDVTFVAAAGAVVPGEGEATVRLLVVLGAVLIAALTFKDTVQGLLKTFLNLLIVLLLAGVLWVQLPSLVGATWLMETVDERSWKILRDFQSLLLASGLALSLVSLIHKDRKQKKQKRH